MTPNPVFKVTVNSESEYLLNNAFLETKVLYDADRKP